MKALKAEIEHIAKLLVEGAESPEALAERVIQAVDEVRAERVTYGAVLRFGGQKTPFFQGFGMFSTKNQALKAIEKHPAADMAKGMAVVPFLNGAGMEQLFASVDAPAASRGDFVEVEKDRQAFKNGWGGDQAATLRDRYL